MALQLDIPIQSIGSTTLTGEQIDRGLQPDECYYIANEPRVRGKKDFDPQRDPPPDLALEVDVTHSSVKRLPALAALGIPEVWRQDGYELLFYRLTEAGQYEQTSQSIAFPFLSPSDIQQFLDQYATMDENSLIRSFVEHARQRADS